MSRMVVPGAVPEWTVSDRLRKAREYAELTQGELAGEIGISQRSVSTYESGAVDVRRPVLLSWALRTGVSLQWLVTGDASADPGPGRPVSSGCRSRWARSSRDMALAVAA